MDTREWSDGVLTLFSRGVVKEPPEVSSWIVCDGDIDPEWIEALNSVRQVSYRHTVWASFESWQVSREKRAHITYE